MASRRISPEMAAYLLKEDAVVGGLPAVQLDDLNKELGLSKEA